MADSFSRRDLLTRTVPAVALAGTVLGASELFAQDAPPAGLPAEGFKDGKYVLPPLPYGYDALEPHIDAQTMELHHSKHHQAYVDGLNKALVALKEARAAKEPINPDKLAGLSRDVSFNAGGHALHTAFFSTLKKDAGALETGGPLGKALGEQYDSLDAFKAHFSAVAAGVKGSGWAVAWYEPIGGQIVITDSGDQDNRMIPGATPILLLDVWEHAYYLKYQNKRADYIKAWWNIVNWAAVNDRYVATRGKK